MRNTNDALILLVDDNPQNLQVLGNLLAGKYTTAIAQNAKQAIAFAKKKNPDLILLDIMMPDVDGFQACRQLKELPETKDIPVIFLSAKTDSDDIVKGFELGGVDYISKPFCVEELLARVNTHIDLRKKSLILQNLADRDGLTMIANRRKFNDFSQIEWRRAFRDKTPLSCILIDIDWFKKYNDHHGHLKGDECLKKVAANITNSVGRPGDLAARFGGEEFAVILANTKREQALNVAENIRLIIEKLNISHENSDTAKFITASFGIATVIPDKDSSIEQLLSMADKQLYAAKKAGRNQVK
jgi:diguanylate cyclase (GGDEF)-like protein